MLIITNISVFRFYRYINVYFGKNFNKYKFLKTHGNVKKEHVIRSIINILKLFC